MTLEATHDGNYVDDGATCSDQVDGMISENVEVSGDVVNLSTLGKYTISYNCKDSAGNAADTAIRIVYVLQTSCPTCAITGGLHISREASFPYEDQGVVCTDLIDGSATVVTNNPVNVEAVANYEVTYRAMNSIGLWSDGAGGACRYGNQVYTRTVSVVDTLQPVITLRYGVAGATPTQIDRGLDSTATGVSNHQNQNAPGLTLTHNQALYTHARVMEAACFLLGNVASSEDGLQDLAQQEGAGVALTVLKAHQHDAELLREILFLVSNMAQSTRIQRDLVGAGAIDLVVAVMDAHTSSAEIIAMGCSSLDNLIGAPEGVDAAHAGTRAQALVSRAVVEKCTLALQTHATEGSVMRRAAGALATMGAVMPRAELLAGNREVVDALVSAGKSAVSGKGQDTQALVQILRALEVLADFPQNRALLVNHGPVALSKSISLAPNARPAPVARALSLMAKLCEAEQQRDPAAARVQEEDGLDMVVQSLATFWNHPAVVIPACTIIAAMAKDAAKEPGETQPAAAQQELWHTALMGLLKALRARPGDVAVAVSACVALAWACERKLVPEPEEVSDIMGAFVMVMRAHPRDADVAEAACFLFASVAKNDTSAIRQQVIKSGAPLLVVMVLRHFSEAPGDVQPVLRRAVNAIRLVGLDDSATAGAVRLAGAPEALRRILQRYSDSQSLHKSVTAALNSIELDGAAAA